MAAMCIWKPYRRILNACRPILQFSRNKTYIKKKLVSREECLKMSRTSDSDYQSILAKLMLSEQWLEFQGTSAEVQLLKNDTSKLEHLYIRPGNSFPTFHRIEMVMQRLHFMSTMGLTSRQKFSIVKKDPPVLILTKWQFLDSSQMVYLRGILKEGTKQRYFFYPVFPRTRTTKELLDERLDDLALRFAATREQVLHLAMSIPCFSINHKCLGRYRDQLLLLHMKLMPEKFDLDMHSLDVHPPILSRNLQTVQNLEKVQFPDLLESNSAIFNGNGCAEDLSGFLLRSHGEETQYKPPVNFKPKRIPRKLKRCDVMPTDRELSQLLSTEFPLPQANIV